MRCEACAYGKHGNCRVPGRCKTCWCAYPEMGNYLPMRSAECSGTQYMVSGAEAYRLRVVMAQEGLWR